LGIIAWTGVFRAMNGAVSANLYESTVSLNEMLPSVDSSVVESALTRDPAVRRWLDLVFLGRIATVFGDPPLDALFVLTSTL
jgi:hypothetical protein